MNPIKSWLDDARAKPSLKYVEPCDGLRTAAVLIVAWFHIWQQSWLFPGISLLGRDISLDPLVRSGYMWVDMMILISGFCLYLPWARMRYEGGTPQRPLDFYARRLARIHPSYLLTLAVMIAVAIGTGAYQSRAHMVRDIASHLTYTHTFFYDAYYASNLGGALWTLAIEMQFYLIFPLLARAFYRLPATTFAAMTVAALSFRGWVAVRFEDVSMYFNQLPAYLDTFALGMLAASLHAWLAQKKHGPVQRILCSLLTLALLPLLWQVVRSQASCPGVEAIRLGQMRNRLSMGLLGAGFLVLSANAGLLVRRLLGNPLTRFFSGISLQFYIWHQTIAVWLITYRVIPSACQNPNWEGDAVWQVQYTAACFALSILVAAAITYGFERPVARRLLRGRHAPKQAEQAEKKGKEHA